MLPIAAVTHRSSPVLRDSITRRHPIFRLPRDRDRPGTLAVAARDRNGTGHEHRRNITQGIVSLPVTVTVFSSSASRVRVTASNELDRCVLVVDVDAGSDVSVDVSEEWLVLAGSEVRVDVGLGVHRLVLPGVKDTLLHEKPVLGWLQNVDEPPDGNTPDDHGDVDVMWPVPVVLEIRKRDELVSWDDVLGVELWVLVDVTLGQ
ncbi:hypothetical protein CHU98_g10119 [Xylaria longipes]|nr:hypothetical protein CHU98_g10119 [Xylaria longipes]